MINKKGETGLLGRTLPALIVMALVGLGVIVGIGNMQTNWGFNTSADFNDTYGYIDTTYSRVDTVQSNVEEESSFLGFDTMTDLVLSVPRLVIDSFGLVATIIGDSIQALGLPYGQTIGRALVIIAIGILIFAVASIFSRRPI